MTKGKVPTGGGSSLSQNPFDKLVVPSTGTSPGSPISAKAPISPPPAPATDSRVESPKNRGRVDILRTTAGRGGKTVTVVQGFTGIGLAEKEDLARRMQKRCGTGGTVKEGRIEIQGDQREAVAEVLTAAGFRPVFAGG